MKIQTGTPLSNKPAESRETGSRKSRAVKAKTAALKDGVELGSAKTAALAESPSLRAAAKTNAPQRDWKMPEADVIRMMRLDEVREAYPELTGQGVTVAVIDTGFDRQDYNDKLVAWKDCVDPRDLNGGRPGVNPRQNRDRASGRPVDEHGHGTYMSGCVNQAAPGAGIAAVRSAGNQGALNKWITRGIEWAIENREKYGIGVLNLSGGTFPQAIPLTPPPQTEEEIAEWEEEYGNWSQALPLNSSPYMLRITGNPICEAIKKAEKAGITVVVAAGNSGPESYTLHDEANEPDTIAVAAAKDEMTVSDFSSRGPSLQNGASKPDITFPGEGIFSWVSRGSLMEQGAGKVEIQRGYRPPQIKRLLKSKPEVIEQMKLPRDILEKSPEEMERLFKEALPNIYLPRYAGNVGEKGTSPACALASGVVALMKQADPELSTPEIKNILKSTARPMGKNFSHNDRGAGFIDAKAAIDEVFRRKGLRRH